MGIRAARGHPVSIAGEEDARIFYAKEEIDPLL
ncbi:hypothetical protein ALPO108162_02295 [Alicyclobacillus pomorum]|jgi:hypothetical protein